MRKELAMIAFPQAAIKMTIIEDGVGISDNMCWYPKKSVMPYFRLLE